MAGFELHRCHGPGFLRTPGQCRLPNFQARGAIGQTDDERKGTIEVLEAYDHGLNGGLGSGAGMEAREGVVR